MKNNILFSHNIAFILMIFFICLNFAISTKFQKVWYKRYIAKNSCNLNWNCNSNSINSNYGYHEIRFATSSNEVDLIDLSDNDVKNNLISFIRDASIYENFLFKPPYNISYRNDEITLWENMLQFIPSPFFTLLSNLNNIFVVKDISINNIGEIKVIDFSLVSLQSYIDLNKFCSIFNKERYLYCKFGKKCYNNNYNEELELPNIEYTTNTKLIEVKLTNLFAKESISNNFISSTANLIISCNGKIDQFIYNIRDIIKNKNLIDLEYGNCNFHFSDFNIKSLRPITNDIDICSFLFETNINLALIYENVNTITIESKKDSVINLSGIMIFDENDNNIFNSNNFVITSSEEYSSSPLENLFVNNSETKIWEYGYHSLGSNPILNILKISQNNFKISRISLINRKLKDNEYIHTEEIIGRIFGMKFTLKTLNGNIISTFLTEDSKIFYDYTSHIYTIKP